MPLCLQKIKAVPRDRRDEIKSRFENFIKNGNANSAHPTQQIRLSPSNTGQSDKLERLLEEITQLRQKTEEFLGPHDSPVYRSLRQSCSKIQLKVDDFFDEVTGKPTDDSSVEARLIKTLNDIQEIEALLNGKVHPRCPKCT